MNEELLQIRTDIDQIKGRNFSVEADKAWETSVARRILIVLLTYLAIGLYLIFLKVDRPFLNAIVPSIGFTLSTLTLPFFKNLWLKHFYKK